eukprot:gene342-141_t
MDSPDSPDFADSPGDCAPGKPGFAHPRRRNLALLLPDAGVHAPAVAPPAAPASPANPASPGRMGAAGSAGPRGWRRRSDRTECAVVVTVVTVVIVILVAVVIVTVVVLLVVTGARRANVKTPLANGENMSGEAGEAGEAGEEERTLSPLLVRPLTGPLGLKRPPRGFADDTSTTEEAEEAALPALPVLPVLLVRDTILVVRGPKPTPGWSFAFAGGAGEKQEPSLPASLPVRPHRRGDGPAGLSSDWKEVPLLVRNTPGEKPIRVFADDPNSGLEATPSTAPLLCGKRDAQWEAGGVGSGLNGPKPPFASSSIDCREARLHVLLLSESQGYADWFGNKLPLIFVDSKSALAVADNPLPTKKSKHLAIRYHLVKEHVSSLCYVPTDVNKADPLTKPLTANKYIEMFVHSPQKKTAKVDEPEEEDDDDEELEALC